jgi:DNA-binding transcriptional LysR family regulator
VGFKPNIAFETDDYVASQSLAHRGFGVTLVPDLILSIVRLPGLRLMAPFPSQSRTVYAVTTNGHLAINSIAATREALIAASDQVIMTANRNDPDILIGHVER